MAGDGFADDADPRAHDSTRDVSGYDAIHGSRVDGEKDDRQEIDREEIDREEIDREEIDREEIYGEEDRRIRGSGQEAGCRLELVAAVERSQ